MLLFCEMIKYILSCDNIDQLLQTLLTNKIRSNIFKTLSSLFLFLPTIRVLLKFLSKRCIAIQKVFECVEEKKLF